MELFMSARITAPRRMQNDPGPGKVRGRSFSFTMTALLISQ